MSSILSDWHSPFAMLVVMQVLLLEPNSGVFRLCETGDLSSRERSAIV